MEKKTFLLVLAQIVCLALFVSMACASQSQEALSTSNRVVATSCADSDFVFVGKFSSKSEAEDAAKAMGLTQVCYEAPYCFAK